MFSDQVFIGCVVNAVNFVSGDIALYPLNIGTKFLQDTAGLLRYGLQLCWLGGSNSGNSSFNHKLGYGNLQKV